MKILLTGKTGQLGIELARTLKTLGELVAVGHQELDLENLAAVRSKIREIRPDLIVNAAAYTAVDKAESDEARAYAVNAKVPGVLAEVAFKLKARLVHYSTDYVFDGAKASAYLETDAPNPLNVYGASKLAGERAIQEVGCKHLILRTSWVYGAHGSNFVKTMLRLAGSRSELKIVNDQVGAPTYSRMIAQATAYVLAHSSAFAQLDGLFHLTSSGATTWKEFAQAIFEEATHVLQRNGINAPALVGVPTRDYPTPARRPNNSRLDCSKIKATFGLGLADWRHDLRLCAQEL